ncbi:MAG: hypothetical protein DRJ56_00015 [Thermoprotei archaeon]|nr:MAG: hypothetical protein DRJ56_00015 [Thermoprotei archaeon]
MSGSPPSEFIPYEVGRFVHLPGHSPVGFLIKLAPQALKIYGILEKIAHVFASRNISILHLKMSRPVPGKPLYMLLFADVRSGDTSRELKGEIERVEYVDEVAIIEPRFDGFATDKFFFPLAMAGSRAVILRRPLYEGLIKGLRSELGSGYEALLYYMGVEMGRRALRDHQRIAGSDPVRLAAVIEEFFRLVGFGVLRIVALEVGSRCVARVYECFECELFKGSGECTSHLVRGMIAGWFAEVSGISSVDGIRAVEVSCIARGDPYCEIVVMAT